VKMKESVQSFYAGKTIFVTGVSSSMGKVLIEKLLFSFANVKEIIVLMKEQAEISENERLENFKKLPVSLKFNCCGLHLNFDLQTVRYPTAFSTHYATETESYGQGFTCLRRD
jgi:hypothetical protein